MKLPKYLILLVFLSLIPSYSFAEPIKRDILAVIDGPEITIETENRVQMLAEMPLEYLGFRLDYVDVSKKLPNDKEMEKYTAIISWFKDDHMENGHAYAKWLARQMKNGKKVLILGYFGFLFDSGIFISPEGLKEFSGAFGIEFDLDESTNSPPLIEVVYKDKAVVEFERTLEGELTSFDRIKSIAPDTKVFLKLKRKDTDKTCDAVFINPHGGLVYSAYVIYENPADHQTRWRINPFIYFAKALGADFPKPDITTINGTRLFTSHIDGDGVNNMSYIDNKSLSGEVVYRDIFQKYELPVTVSTVVGDIIKGRDGIHERPYNLFRSIFALPNIEPASHGWAHPLIWNIAKRKIAYKLPGYKYSPENEIGKSIEYINKNLAPPDKKTDIFLWTGDCLPDYEALKYTYDNDILALNGGDSRFDSEYPSYTFVAPLFRYVEGLRQFLSPDSNEVIYTNIWTGPFYGFRNVIETYKRTESPIRIKPVDIYYHFYIAEYDVSLETVTNAYDWALKQDIIPVFLSDYIKIVKGFLSTDIEKTGIGWKISGNGDLKTVRFDGNSSNVDLARSKGIIGFNHYQGSLYVHLKGDEESLIYLTNAPQGIPYIVRANGKVYRLKTGRGTMDLTINTIGEVHLEVGGLSKNKNHTVTLQKLPRQHEKTLEAFKWMRQSKDMIIMELKSDADGVLKIRNTEILGSAFESVEVNIKEAI